MPREDRRIIFDMEETYEALYTLCEQQKRDKPPPGVIKAIENHANEKDRLFFSIENRKLKTVKDVAYGRDFVAAALMLFCRGAGIPLPKTAKKSVVLGKGNITLRVEI